MLAEDDPVKMEMDIVDEQLDTTARTFMGLTVGCARCHDHKFDPIPQADYYSMAGIFKSSKTMENFKVVAKWHEYVLAPEERTRELQGTRRRSKPRAKRSSDLGSAENDKLAAEAHAGSALICWLRRICSAMSRSIVAPVESAPEQSSRRGRLSIAAMCRARSRKKKPMSPKTRRVRSSRSTT